VRDVTVTWDKSMSFVYRDKQTMKLMVSPSFIFMFDFFFNFSFMAKRARLWPVTWPCLPSSLWELVAGHFRDAVLALRLTCSSLRCLRGAYTAVNVNNPPRGLECELQLCVGSVLRSVTVQTGLQVLTKAAPNLAELRFEGSFLELRSVHWSAFRKLTKLVLKMYGWNEDEGEQCHAVLLLRGPQSLREIEVRDELRRFQYVNTVLDNVLAHNVEKILLYGVRTSQTVLDQCAALPKLREFHLDFDETLNWERVACVVRTSPTLALFLRLYMNEIWGIHALVSAFPDASLYPFLWTSCVTFAVLRFAGKSHRFEEMLITRGCSALEIPTFARHEICRLETNAEDLAQVRAWLSIPCRQLSLHFDNDNGDDGAARLDMPSGLSLRHLSLAGLDVQFPADFSPGELQTLTCLPDSAGRGGKVQGTVSLQGAPVT